MKQLVDFMKNKYLKKLFFSMMVAVCLAQGQKLMAGSFFSKHENEKAEILPAKKISIEDILDLSLEEILEFVSQLTTEEIEADSSKGREGRADEEDRERSWSQPPQDVNEVEYSMNAPHLPPSGNPNSDPSLPNICDCVH
jgi:hypothetical protein